jgi:calcineurin-like phosphoesterase family protein
VRWFTADLHFGHENIIRYCRRPFADVADMNESLIERWNERVDDDDEVWVLGDVAMGRIDESLGLVGRLRGSKVLVTGNHDRCWPRHPRQPHEWEARYRDAGFATILHGTVETTVGDEPVLAGHFPYEGDSHDDDRFTQERPADHGRWLLHGHVHTRWKVHDRQINVGVDVWDYAPVAEDTIATCIEQAG